MARVNFQNVGHQNKYLCTTSSILENVKSLHEFSRNEPDSFFENPIKLVQLFRNQLFIIITDSNSFFVNKYLRIQYEKEIIWPIFYKFDHLSVCCMIILDNTIQSWLIPNKFFKIITDSNFIVYIFLCTTYLEKLFWSIFTNKYG